MPELEFVAVDGDSVVGHVLCSRAHVDESEVVALGPLAVHPDQQRRAVGSTLVHAVLDQATAAGEQMVGLLGHPSYYPRFGFRRGSELGVQPPRPMDDDAPFMVKALGDATLPRGTFRYCSAFAGLDS